MGWLIILFTSIWGFPLLKMDDLGVLRYPHLWKHPFGCLIEIGYHLQCIKINENQRISNFQHSVAVAQEYIGSVQMRGCWNLHVFLSQCLGAVILVARLILMTGRCESPNPSEIRAQLGQALSAAEVRRWRLYSVPSLSCPQWCWVLIENRWLTRYLRAQMQHAKSTKVQLPLLTLTPAWTVLQARHCFMPHTRADLSSLVSSSIMFNRVARYTAIIKADVDPRPKLWKEVLWGRRWFWHAFDQRHWETCLALVLQSPSRQTDVWAKSVEWCSGRNHAGELRDLANGWLSLC